MTWHGPVVKRLRESSLFADVSLTGAKVRASLSETLFLDIHFNPSTGSCSYALIDLTLPHPGDKRILGWDDYPHEGIQAIQDLSSFPHHLQRRAPSGAWIFEESEMRGDIESEMSVVLDTLSAHLGL